ncbi:MAG: hypothetical protein DRI56_11370 [Chloroflexota bacterium]|nr:MAG: hypothetical protein B6243_02065 [Anaerolineaceae bacterium 4572_5.2]RLD04334.1 MAG: hypothetical protein DRI56_11370 [Chloroflexota bacterium]
MIINDSPVDLVMMAIASILFFTLGLISTFHPIKIIEWHGRIMRFQLKMMGATDEKIGKIKVPFEKIFYKKGYGQFIIGAEDTPEEYKGAILAIRVLGFLMASAAILMLIVDLSVVLVSFF